MHALMPRADLSVARLSCLKCVYCVYMYVVQYRCSLAYCSIDAHDEPLRKPKFGRLIKHSKKCKNCRVQAVQINGQPQLCIYALRDLWAGVSE